MEKHNLTASEFLDNATAHARAAERLLIHFHQTPEQSFSDLSPAITLIYQAFQQLLRAYAQHDHRRVKQIKSIGELLELTPHLPLEPQQLDDLKVLNRQYRQNKGQSYNLWENVQELHVFCVKMLDLFANLLELMPLELEANYRN